MLETDPEKDLKDLHAAPNDVGEVGASLPGAKRRHIPFVGWILALITAIALLYMKSDGFKRYVNSLVKWVLALLDYILAVLTGWWLDLLS